MSDPKVIPLAPSRNSKVDSQGNNEEGAIIIENPDAPVNLDEDKMPPATTTHVYPPETQSE